MDCKITCNGKEAATIKRTENGILIECTKEGRKLCRELGEGCC